jgi:hypothetical protein
MGGKIYTTAAWVTVFGERLAEADAAYFDASPGQFAVPPRPQSRIRRSRRPAPEIGHERERRAALDRELDAEGL